jgi:hypothetical protein
VDGRDLAPGDRERRRERGVAVHDRLDVGPRREEANVERELGARAPAALGRAAVGLDDHDVLDGQLVVLHRRWGDRDPPIVQPDADVPGRSDREAPLSELPGHADDLAPRLANRVAHAGRIRGGADPTAEELGLRRFVEMRPEDDGGDGVPERADELQAVSTGPTSARCSLPKMLVR